MSESVNEDPLVVDAKLSARLEKRSVVDPEFWDFRELRERPGSHGLFQYPAMMVPELQGALLDDVLAIDPSVSSVYDPFTGSGTVLVESITRGLAFVGGDINPMAILLSSVKADPPTRDEARGAYKETMRRTRIDTPSSGRTFFGRDKWFTPRLLDELERLRVAIQSIKSLRQRRFLWVCLAEAVRLTSNSRISTFKLHLYPDEVLRAREASALGSFDAVAKRNILGLEEYWRAVDSSAFEVGRATLLQGPAQMTWSEAIAAPDVLMTSPPYGDNRTTVPYGQHSYLPLQWIDGDDIEGGLDDALLATTAAIDTASLGGSNRGVLERRAELSDRSPSIARFLELVEGRGDLTKKVLAFTGDYYDTLRVVTSRLRPNAYSLFTLGERRVGRERFPLVSITKELLDSTGHRRVHEFHRNLPRRKRMAIANSEGATMATETVLVTRRKPANG